MEYLGCGFLKIKNYYLKSSQQNTWWPKSQLTFENVEGSTALG